MTWKCKVTGHYERVCVDIRNVFLSSLGLSLGRSMEAPSSILWTVLSPPQTQCHHFCPWSRQMNSVTASALQWTSGARLLFNPFSISIANPSLLANRDGWRWILSSPAPPPSMVGESRGDIPPTSLCLFDSSKKQSDKDQLGREQKRGRSCRPSVIWLRAAVQKRDGTNGQESE
jgi:hypothetical protein